MLYERSKRTLDIGIKDALRLKLINASINENTGLGYKIADVFSAFDGYSQSTMGDITYLYPSIFSYLFRNPHPNSNGQSIITNLHKTVYSKWQWNQSYWFFHFHKTGFFSYLYPRKKILKLVLMFIGKAKAEFVRRR